MRVRCGHGGRWVGWVVAAAVAVGLTFGVMRISMDRGRLATYPRVDDVIYMARGAEMWAAGRDGWMRDGVGGVVKGVARDWRREPPHAPWTTVCAAGGFACFGVREWAAYVFTGVPVLAFLLAAGRIARRAGGRFGWRGALLMVLAGSAPFLAASVQNLKPDYCAGICTAIGMMILLRGPALAARWQRLAWVGVWFGLALLAKPAMMIGTVLLLGGTIGVCVVRDVVVAWPRMRAGWTAVRGGRVGLVAFGVATVIALPHYWFALGHVWAYSTGILEGDAWAFQGTVWERLAFYVTGPGGRLMLDGGRTWVGLAGVLAWTMWEAMVGSSRRRRAMSVAMLGALGMAWAGPTVARVMIAQFAAAFDALLWLMVVHGLSRMVREPRRAWRGTRGRAELMWEIVGWFTVVLLVGFWRVTFPTMPERRDDPRREGIEIRGAFVREMYEAIRSAGAENAGRRDGEDGVGEGARVVMCGSPTDLGTPLLEFWAIRDGARWNVRELRRVPGRSPEETALAALRERDVIVVHEPGMGLARVKEVTAEADGFYLKLARTTPGLRLVRRLSDPVAGKGVEVWVWENRRE